MTELPDRFEAVMTKDDILKAYEARDGRISICEICPVAQVLYRMFPGYSWSVGYGSASASKNGELVMDYVFEPRTMRWIRNLSGRDWDKARPHGKFKVRSILRAPGF